MIKEYSLIKIEIKNTNYAGLGVFLNQNLRKG